MNAEQMKLLLPLLEKISQALGNNSCNDWRLPDTPEGQALWRAINAWVDPKDYIGWAQVENGKPTPFLLDFIVIDYLCHCIENNLIQPE